MMRTRRHWMTFLQGWRGAAIILLLVLAHDIPALWVTASFLILLIRLPSWIPDTYEITQDELVIREGFLIPFHEYQIKLSKIESVELDTGLLGKVLGYGDLKVTCVGGTEFRLQSIPHARDWYKRLNN